MNVKDLEQLYDYSYWANARLFQVMAELSPEQFTQTVAGSYGSLRNTLVHTLSAEWGWMERCGGPKRGPRLDPADYPDLESLQRTWTSVQSSMRTFLSTLADDDLARLVEFSFEPGVKGALPLGELLHHGAIHGVHHRGQVVLLLRVLGYTPGNVDVLFYHAERRQPSAA